MTLFFHELRQGRLSLAVWTLCIGFFVLVCILMYPEFEGQMEEMGTMFASMGGFTAAFGMDRLNIGTLTGFYAIECGSIIGLGGAFYAVLTGISALAKEETGHTAEFLLTHPVSRIALREASCRLFWYRYWCWTCFASDSAYLPSFWLAILSPGRTWDCCMRLTCCCTWNWRPSVSGFPHSGTATGWASDWDWPSACILPT